MTQTQNSYPYLHPYPYQEPIEKTTAGARLARSTSLATSVSDAAAPTAKSARHECNERQTGAAQVRVAPAAHARGIQSASDLIAWSEIGRAQRVEGTAARRPQTPPAPRGQGTGATPSNIARPGGLDVLMLGAPRELTRCLDAATRARRHADATSSAPRSPNAGVT
jgi:hypothetical protein